MFEDDKKEFDPSESEEFLKAINEVLDLPEDDGSDVINIKTNKSQIIDIPDESEVRTETLSDSEFDACDVALAQNLAEMFDDVDVAVLSRETSSEENNESLVLPDEKVEETNEFVEQSVQQSKKENDDEPASTDDANIFFSDNDFSQDDSSEEQDIINDINAALSL